MARVPPPALGKPAGPGELILERRRRLLDRSLSLEGKVLLDFGCGNGAQTIAVAGRGCRVIGVDVQEDQLARFRQTLKNLPALPVLPVRYDGLHLPLRSSSVDAVMSFEVLEHVQDERAVLAEIRRVLKPTGDLLITVPNRWWVFETHGARLPLLPWNRVPLFSWLPRRIHRRFALARNYSRGEIIALVHGAGFLVRNVCYVTAPMDALRHEGLRRLLRATIFRTDDTRWGVLATAIFLHATNGAKS